MPLHKLLAGTHIQGNNEPGGITSKKYKWNDLSRKDSEGNIFWSDEDLTLQDPKKYELYRGPVPEHLKEQVRGRQTAGIGEEEADTSGMNADELEEHARILVQRAADVRQRANKVRQREAQTSEEETAQEQRSTTTEKQPINPATASAVDREYHESIDRMSLSHMKSHAEERGVDIKGLNTREAIAQKIKTTPREVQPKREGK